MNYYCNPINYSYKYQFNKLEDGRASVSREGADPSLISFKGKYFIFPSMTAGFIYSDDLCHFDFHPFKNLPAYDYAPDVRVCGDYLYFCASNHEKGIYFRTKDPFLDEYEMIEGDFVFWDPNQFFDDDGRMYFFWGSSTIEPLYGIELDPVTCKPIGEKVELCYIDAAKKGFERTAENHIPARTQEEIDVIINDMKGKGMADSMIESAMAYIKGSPYMEGVWVDKHEGKYYLQYGANGSRFNVYADGVYVADKPLGPYKLAKNNPYSYKPGGFCPGAGHGSTMEDYYGNIWHVATNRICVNHNFERRISLWPAGYDEDGELFCNQRFGDWVRPVLKGKTDPWENPQWMLLSYGKTATASSEHSPKLNRKNDEGTLVEDRYYDANQVLNEDIRTCWMASEDNYSQSEADIRFNISGKDNDEWIQVDLGKEYDVYAVQINFADEGMVSELPDGADFIGALHQKRFIDERDHKTNWLLEGSVDGVAYYTIEDKRNADTDLPHDLVVRDNGFKCRYVRLSHISLPYNQVPTVSGIRVFGLDKEKEPPKSIKACEIELSWQSELDLNVSFPNNSDALGYEVEWGYSADKLYHSYQIFDNQVNIGGLVLGQDVYLRVTAFNEAGITEGEIVKA